MQAMSKQPVLRYVAQARNPTVNPLQWRCDMLSGSRITTPAVLTLSLALGYSTYLAMAAATTAEAMPTPPPEEATYANQSPPAVTTVVNHTGSPVWTYVVVALAAAVLTLATTWAVTRLLHPRAHTASVSAP